MSITHTETWSETKPAGSRARSLGDDDIREFKRAFRERFAADHIALAEEAGSTDIGYHKKITFAEVQSSAPTNEANHGYLYIQDVSGVAELFWEDESGNVKILTNQGKLNVESDEAVLLLGAQTVEGVKTFGSFPVTPSEAPTTDYQVPNKKYVDDNKGSTVSVLSGTAAHGATIPLPAGYAEGSCKWLVSLGDLGSYTGGDGDNLQSVVCTATGTRVVTCYGKQRDNGTVTGTANYIIIGVS